MSTDITEWQDTTLEELCIPGGIQTGPFGSQLKASEYTENGIPIIMPKDFVGNQIRHSDVSRISHKKAAELKRHMVKKGDIIFGRRGEIGRCALITSAEEGWICGTGSLRVRPSPAVVHSEFLFHYLTMPHVVSWLETNAVGQTMLNLSSGILARLPLTLPPLPEQRQIAEILSTWDEAIVKTEQLIASLQQRKKGLMQRLLTGEVRFPGFNNKWIEIELGQFLKPVVRKVEKPKDGYMRLGLRSHGKGTFISTMDDVDSEAVAMTHLFKVKEGDLIVNITFAWEGAIAIVGKDGDGALVSHRFPTYTFNTNKVLPEYFQYVMLTKRFFYDLGLISPGGAGRNRVMSKKDF